MKNQIKLGIVISYVTIFAGLIISLLYTPFMLKTIGENQYGLYTLVSAVVGYLGLLNFGFSSSYMRYFAKYNSINDQQAIKRLNGMFLTVFTFLSFVVFVVGVFILPNLGTILGSNIVGKDLEVAKVLFFIMLLNLSTPLITTTFNVFVIAHERFIFLKVLSLLKTLFNPLLMIPMLLLGYESVGMAMVTLILTFIFEIIIVFYAIKVLRISFNFKHFDFSLMKEMIIFSSFIFLNMIIDQINWSVDKFILGRFKGTVAVAVYGVASQINYYYLMFSTQVSGVFTPKVNKLVAEGNKGKELLLLFTRIGRIQFIILGLILLGFYAFGYEFIILWAGEAYVNAYYVTLILIGSVTIPLIQNTGIEIQRAKNMHKFRSIMYFIIAIGNIFVSIPFVQQFGPVGAAFGTAIALLIGNGVIMNWYYHNYVDLDMFFFWKNIGKLSIGMIIPFFVAIMIKEFMDFNNIYLYLASIIFFCGVYFISVWKLGMNTAEKNLLISPLKKILIKVGGLIYDKN